MQFAPGRRDETRPDARRVAKRFAFVETDNQGINAIATRSESANHELLPNIDAHFGPGSASPARFISRAQSFCDDSFATNLPHSGEELFNRPDEVFAVLNNIRGHES